MLTLISIACNHPDNGHFRGRFDAMHYGNDQDMELQHVHWYHGVRVRYLGNGRVRISRRVFRFEREKEWYGNWCWNALWMELAEARRLLRYLRESGRWHCEGGPVRLYEWFNNDRNERSGHSKGIEHSRSTGASELPAISGAEPAPPCSNDDAPTVATVPEPHAQGSLALCQAPETQSSRD